MPDTSNLEVHDLRKVYPGTVALKGVSLKFAYGEVHALIGKNGAGKSTLVKLISGAIQPTSGRISLKGVDVKLRSPREAFRHGIAAVYQELSLVPDLSVAHNILLADLPTKMHGMITDWPHVYTRAGKLLQDLNITLDVHQPVRTLGVAGQQMVEIAKAMASAPSVLLLDEPTSALAYHETESLFHLIRTLTSRGVSIIYISHRLQELRHIANRVSVLRDGELVGTIKIEEATPERVGHMMFGEAVPKLSLQLTQISQDTLLEARGLCKRNVLQDVSFSLRRGEILGIAGLLGSGRTELLRALCGADRLDAGEIMINGQVVKRPTVKRMKQLGVGMIPENRQEEGLILLLSTRDNACLACTDRLSWHGIIWDGLKYPVVEGNVSDLGIAVSDIGTPVGTLSGGNQQKVVVAKWMNTCPKVFLFDEPTRGIDIQAKQQIFQLIRNLSDKGISSILVSSELDELVEVCHRILIMQDGSIVGEVISDTITPQRLFELCIPVGPAVVGDSNNAN